MGENAAGPRFLMAIVVGWFLFVLIRRLSRSLSSAVDTTEVDPEPTPKRKRRKRRVESRNEHGDDA